MRFRVLTIIAICAAITACAALPLDRVTRHPDPLLRPVVDRLAHDEVRIRWPTSFATGLVQVYAGLSPDEIDYSAPVGTSRDGSQVLTTGDHPYVEDDYRLYYELVREGKPSRIVAERRLPLDGPDNTRDLGGYRTEDGHSVGWGLLYRSNDLSQLTNDDRRYLAGIGLKLVCDFRSLPEQRRAPDRRIDPILRPANLPMPILPDELSLPVDQNGVDPDEMQNKIRTGGIAALAVEETMTLAYRAFVVDHSAQWAAMFERLADPDSLPALMHCTAGKDRTGFASALVLRALGVSHETIVEDYLLSNFYRDGFHRVILRWVPLYSFFRTNPEDLLPLLEARRSYLQTAFDTIDDLHGSFDTYLEQVLGVDAERLEALRANLLD